MQRIRDSEDTIKLSDIHPNPRNPRVMKEAAFKKLCDSVKRDPAFMELRPIIVDEKQMILGGNQRYQACKHLGMTDIPASWVQCADTLTEEQRKRFIVLDNAPSGIAGEWDFDMLANEWDIDELIGAGFSEEELGAFTVDEAGAPELKDGDRAPFQQMTFTLHDEQVEAVNAAVKKAQADGHGESAVNENSNGNALAWIAEVFNRG